MSTKKTIKPVAKAKETKKVAVVKEAVKTSIDVAGVDSSSNKEMIKFHVADIIWGDIKPDVVEDLSDLVSQFIGLYLSQLVDAPCEVVKKDPCCCKKQACKAEKPVKKVSPKKAKKAAK